MNKLMSVMGTGGFKIFLLLVLVLFFLIPTAMIRGLIHERSQRAEEAERTIMEAWGDTFTAQGPVLRIPCIERQEIRNRNEKGIEQLEIRERPFSFWITPEWLDVDIRLGTEIKKRGIFSVPLFSGTVRLSGAFDPGKVLGELKDSETAFPAEGELIIALAGQRGIRGVEKADWDGGPIRFLPGNRGFPYKGGEAGIYGKTPAEAGRKYAFDITLSVQGGKSLLMVPLGEDSSFSVAADWPSPSFRGAYLPLTKNLHERGFEARWEISHLSRNIPLSWAGYDEAGSELSSALFGVDFFKALDHYDVNTRAVKYALLFIIIPFLSLFLFEMVSRRNIHPVQYLLSGVGNIVFYLLLLSFSEHLPFLPAYWISALA
ncbi:MAG: inner membrane CreD family protein, partial [Spirochaetaceae bacterium]|nr:inner membrane CreD family protein [Spirochaetaceae bacterium]